MKILERFIKSLSDDSQSNVTLSKAVGENETSIEALLSKIDGVGDLQKSNIPENADIKAEKEVAENTDSVFTVEKKEDEQENPNVNGKKVTTDIPENATIKAEKEVAEETDTVFSSEKVLGEAPKSAKQAEVHLRKAKKEEAEVAVKKEAKKEGESEEEEEEEKGMKDKSDMFKHADADTMEMFDVSLPLAELKKAVDMMADEVISLRKSQAQTVDLIKAIAEVESKSFVLNKSIATALDELGGTPNEPKGQVSVLRKSFVNNDQVGMPSVTEFSNAMFKSMEAGKISVDQASRMIANAETAGSVDPSYMSAYEAASK